MSTLFSARRKPKRIARDEPDLQPDPEEDTGPVVRRPTTNAPKNKSKLRVSFNPGEGDDSFEGSLRATASGGRGGDGEQRDASSTLSTRTSRLGLSGAAQSLQNRASIIRDVGASTGDSEGQNHDRPSYSKAYLDELRNSTPSTPRELSSRESPSLELIETTNNNTALDLESKFGKSALNQSSSSSHIPTAAEIREKKERRARLAKEQLANASTTSRSNNDEDDFIPLESYDSDGEFKPRALQVGSFLGSSSREKDTRLIHDDEDIAEGFESFIEDSGRVSLSKKGLRAQSKADREAIRNMIDEAEGSDNSEENISGHSSGSDDDSDYARHQAYEMSQTHHGMDGLSSHHAHTRIASRPRQPRETTSIPKLSVGLTRLRDMASKLEYDRARVEKRRADILRERADIVESQRHIQASLEEAGRELERITATSTQQQQQQRQNANASVDTNGAVTAILHVEGTNGLNQQSGTQERGLESFGATPERGS